MNGINPENGNACTTATASEGSKDSDTIWLDELFLRYWISTLAAAQQAQQMVQPAVDWLSRPRNPMCMAGFAGAGAAVGGFSGGGVGALGFAGGPAGFATTPAFSASGAALGGGIGGLGGMIMCSSGTSSSGGGGSGSGELGGAARRKLGNLASRADEKVRDVIRSRGGTASNVNQVGQWADRTLGEAAEAAVNGDRTAETAIKIAKQAASKGQQY